MQQYLKSVPSEIFKTIKNPSRLGKVFNKSEFHAWRRSFLPENQKEWKDSSWTQWEEEENSFKIRQYENYEHYVRHQKSKLERFMVTNNAWIKNYDKVYYEVLKERLKPHIQKRMSVLCLAARLGTEVRSFIDLGCFAVGIDLNPGQENKYVVVGDFHHLQYADESIDLVFTNSFDHALMPNKIISEVKRVLQPNGRFIIEIALGLQQGTDPGDYESFFWNQIEDIVELVEQHDFKVAYTETIKKPFNGGKFMIFQKVSE
ncbi:hypothetical protein C7H19_07205 [Aphanothece hegewaldii CCALA 016]|uniref:Methyltransferase type 11 domain-containing protein n=1 Tax=Aphanothece hegewaldii CCALA 016 TaxID=2107694 RepID=A0A2T1M0P9_9CHRO|nr:class I SAM-dependent methyltransferase [Aphanothece hegewaldii]PSF38248.1 hypothetical protein C7H19_07205 [Aphanothece hegewaldii CCALA 016]